MKHAHTRLTEELRLLIQTWRCLRVDVSMPHLMRQQAEQQTAQEVLETWSALAMIGRNLGIHRKMPEEVAHIVSTLGGARDVG